MTAALVALGAGLLLFGVLMFGYRHRASAATAADNRLPPRTSHVGRRFAPIVGLTPLGDPIVVDVAGDGERRVLFLTSTCITCHTIWSSLGASPTGPLATPAVVVTPSPSTESARKVRSLSPPGVTVVMASEVWHAYAVTGAPWYIDICGEVISGEGRP